ncbi:MAG: hypothetical protein QOG10_4627 [Kribbellaceae bacterium]|nr:hypothetical protein [Kribbellaceae bacterium]
MGEYTIEDLRGRTRGPVLTSSDEAYEEARKVRNGMIDKHPRVIVQCMNAGDVMAAVDFAATNELDLAVRGGAHSVPGFGTCDDGVVADLSGIRNVRVDPMAQTARAGGGATWGDFNAATHAFGLATTGGIISTTGVGGLTLGGGIGYLARGLGLSCDNLISADVVTADGRFLIASDKENEDLFWALRGGGGDFAVVTALELELYPVPTMYGGRVIWPDHRTREVYDAFLEITAEAPRELSVWINRLQPPGASPMVTLDLAYLGEAAQGEDLLARLDKIEGPISDSRGVVPVAELGDITAEPTDPAPTITRAELLTGLDTDAVELLLAKPVEPLISMQIRHLGGALSEPGGGAGASGAVAEPYLLGLLGLGLPHVADATRAKQAEVVADLEAYISGRKPYTLLSPGETAAKSFSGSALARLREIKRARDPHNVFRANYPVLV